MKTAECEHGSIYFSNTTLSHVKYNVLSACLFGRFHVLDSVALELTTLIVLVTKPKNIDFWTGENMIGSLTQKNSFLHQLHNYYSLSRRLIVSLHC